MRTFLVAVLVLLSFTGAKAALFINNNTNCPVVVEIYAHDLNHGFCGLHSGRIYMPPMSSLSFNNVADLNASPGWQGQTAVTTGGPGVWGWDGAAFNGAGGGLIGNTSTCFSTDNMTVPNGCIPVANVTAAWTVIGSNVLLEFS